MFGPGYPLSVDRRRPQLARAGFALPGLNVDVDRSEYQREKNRHANLPYYVPNRLITLNRILRMTQCEGDGVIWLR